MNTLPFLTRLILGTILAKQDKVLIAELIYLRSEIDYLHAQLPEGHQFRFTDSW